MTKILLIGKSANLHCIAETLSRSPKPKKLYSFFPSRNPGLRFLSSRLEIGKPEHLDHVLSFAQKVKPDFAIIASEEPLARGIVDLLGQIGIPSVGPVKILAELEASNAFTRQLLDRYGIKGNPRCRIFKDTEGLFEYLASEETYVVKPDGLTGGKGVKVYGKHIFSHDEAYQYCSWLLSHGHKAVVIEELLQGEEFSIQVFADGTHAILAPLAQDHKLLLLDDRGPTTGGMGSYSCADHRLPFLTADDTRSAYEITCAVMHALYAECGIPYQGILYGGFMRTKNGIYLLEYNIRFADPEAMNILPLLETDFIDLCEAILNKTLHRLKPLFSHQATVCKYVVPTGYPAHSIPGIIDLDSIPMLGKNLRIYYGGIHCRRNQYHLTGSRALACVGIADTLADAERISEDAACRIKGPVYHRTDIGTADLIQKRIAHIESWK